MKIEVWSDYVCPFCFIGKRQLEKALEAFAHQSFVMVEYKSYQLDPEAKYIPGKDFYEVFSEMKGISLSQAKTMNEQVKEQAKTAGLDYRFDTMKYANTFDAHRLAHYAHTKSLGSEMTEQLLLAYFIESEVISDRRTLIKIAEKIGLDKEEAEEVLATERYKRQVNEDLEMAKQLGIQGVPFFVFNEKYALSGVQSPEVLSKVLEKVWEEEGKTDLQNRKKIKTSYCTDEGCVDC